MSRVDDHWRLSVIDPGHRSGSYLLFSAACEPFFPLRLPKTIKAHCSASCESKFLLHCFSKWKSKWNLSLSGEETSGILSVQTSSLFQSTLSNTGPRNLKLLFFLSLKRLEDFFSLFKTEKLVVSSLRKVKQLPPCSALLQRAVYLILGETIKVESRKLYLLSVFFNNSQVSYFLLISSGCCIRECSLFQHHWGAKTLVCFLFLAAVRLKNDCWLLWSFISLPFWCNTSACLPFLWEELNGPRRHLWCIRPEGLSDCEYLFPCRDLCGEQRRLWQHVSRLGHRSALQLSCWLHSAARSQNLQR